MDKLARPERFDCAVIGICESKATHTRLEEIPQAEDLQRADVAMTLRLTLRVLPAVHDGHSRTSGDPAAAATERANTRILVRTSLCQCKSRGVRRVEFYGQCSRIKPQLVLESRRNGC